MDIAAWYLPTMLVQNEELLKKRREGTAAVISAIQPNHVVELVKLAYGLSHAAGVIDEIMKSYTVTDESFNATAQPHATAILADCILASLMTETKEAGLTAALAILCADGIIPRAAKYHPQLRDLAENVCGTGMVTSVPALPKLGKLREKMAEHLKPLKADAATPPQIVAALKPLFTAAVDDQREHARFSDDLVDALIAQQQQVNILWWMLGEWSEQLDKPFSEVPSTSAAIIAGLELAEFIKTREVPRCAKAVLFKVLSLTSDAEVKIGLIDAVNGCPRDWRERSSPADLPREIYELAPVLLALQSSLATDSKDTWQPVFEKALGTKKFTKVKKIDLALQTFREALLWEIIA